METWGEKKEKGLFRFVLWNRERKHPNTHDTNMEGRKEHGGKEGKERTRERKGKERKDAKTFQSSPKLAYVRYMYVYVYLYLKSRIHD